MLSLDIGDYQLDGVDLSGNPTPDELFSAAWREAVMDEALRRLETQLNADGKSQDLTLFKRYDLGEEDPPPAYATLAKEYNLSVPQVKHALLRARAGLRNAVTEIVRDYVDDPGQLASEMQFLLES